MESRNDKQHFHTAKLDSHGLCSGYFTEIPTVFDSKLALDMSSRTVPTTRPTFMIWSYTLIMFLCSQ